jgi:hypothetical protein
MELKFKENITKSELEVKVDKEEVESFLDKITPEFVRHGVGILGDNVRSWRIQNQFGILQKTKKKVEDSGLKMSQIKLKELCCLIDYSSLEEDENMQEKWSNMLSNAITRKYSLKLVYIELLKQISNEDLKLLYCIKNLIEKDEEQKQNPSTIDGLDIDKITVKKFRTYTTIDQIKKGSSNIGDFTDIDIMIDNLERLNIINYGPITTYNGRIVRFTSLGKGFLEACS